MPQKPPSNNHSLVSLANPKLAEKLDRAKPGPTKAKQNKSSFIESMSFSEASEFDDLVLEQSDIKTQTWRALFFLNVLRYGFALWMLLSVAVNKPSPWLLSSTVAELKPLLWGGALILLVSAILFSWASKQQKLPIGRVLVAQFVLDLVILSSITLLSPAPASEFFIVYFIIVTTGSVVLSRVNALGLASAAVCLLLAEPLVRSWLMTSPSDAEWALIAANGATLLFGALLISSFAQYIGKNQLSRFAPGNESLETFLLREEKKAIRAALEKTKGNKTQAAALLGMSFRSFRYKLSKHSLD